MTSTTRKRTPQISPPESDGVQQFQFQTSKLFPQYNQLWNAYELVECGDRKNTVWSQNKRMVSLNPPRRITPRNTLLCIIYRKSIGFSTWIKIRVTKRKFVSVPIPWTALNSIDKCAGMAKIKLNQFSTDPTTNLYIRIYAFDELWISPIWHSVIRHL